MKPSPDKTAELYAQMTKHTVHVRFVFLTSHQVKPNNTQAVVPS